MAKQVLISCLFLGLVAMSAAIELDSEKTQKCLKQADNRISSIFAPFHLVEAYSALRKEGADMDKIESIDKSKYEAETFKKILHDCNSLNIKCIGVLMSTECGVDLMNVTIPTAEGYDQFVAPKFPSIVAYNKMIHLCQAFWKSENE